MTDDFVINVPLVVPGWVKEGLDNGELFRLGGTIRKTVGRRSIAHHLRDASSATETGRVAARRIASAVKAHPAAIGAAGVVVASTVATLAVQWNKTQGAVKEFNAELRNYFDAARGGTLDADVIERLLVAVDRLESRSRGPLVSHLVPTRNLDAMVMLVAGYTRQIAEAHAAVLEEELPGKDGSQLNGTVVELRSHLRAQQRIFTPAA